MPFGLRTAYPGGPDPRGGRAGKIFKGRTLRACGPGRPSFSCGSAHTPAHTRRILWGPDAQGRQGGEYFHRDNLRGLRLGPAVFSLRGCTSVQCVVRCPVLCTILRWSCGHCIVLFPSLCIVHCALLRLYCALYCTLHCAPYCVLNCALNCARRCVLNCVYCTAYSFVLHCVQIVYSTPHCVVYRIACCAPRWPQGRPKMDHHKLGEDPRRIPL